MHIAASPFLLHIRFGLRPLFGFQHPGPLLQLLRSAAGGCNTPTNEDSVSSSPLRAPFHWPRRFTSLWDPRGISPASPPQVSALLAPPLRVHVGFDLARLPALARALHPPYPPLRTSQSIALPPPFGFQRSAPLLQILSSAAERWDTPTNIDGISPSPLPAPFRSPWLVCSPRASPRSPAPCTAPSRFSSLREPRGISPSPAYPPQVSALVAPPFRAYVSFGPAPLPALAQALRPPYPPMQLSHGLCIAHSHLLLAP
ncbi:hypothetical protein B0H11DRAFT_2250579 [Mycena galericulata]|nr:hypothetical protein B0H11DRAFT_2250579 [Mycena galericulata]